MRGIPRQAAGLALVVLLTLTGASLLVAAFTATPPRPPQPAAAAAPPNLASTPERAAPRPTPSGPGPTTPSTTPATTPSAPASPATSPSPATATPTPAATRGGMARSVPVTVTIPAIGVDARVVKLGLRKDGTLQVPSPEKAYLAGWYKYGPTPGEVGNAVIVGHVDSAKLGPAVFFRLGELQPGQRIQVTRADGSVATFVVDGVKAFPKKEFPTELVYGQSDKPGLRLITCGGPWSKESSYRDNVIVFATLASARG